MGNLNNLRISTKYLFIIKISKTNKKEGFLLWSGMLDKNPNQVSTINIGRNQNQARSEKLQ
jgi:hypothetical protein